MKLLPLSFAILLILAGCSSDDKATEAEAGETEQGAGDASSPVDNTPPATTDDPPSSPAESSPTTTTDDPAASSTDSMTTTDDPAESTTDSTPETATDDPPSSTTDSSPTTIGEPPAPPLPPSTDDQPAPTDEQQTTTDTVPTTDTSTLVSQLVNSADNTGAALSGWDCRNQDDEQVAFFVFFGDGSGTVQTSADGNDVDISWSEAPDNSILMSIASTGDSQLQSVTFSNPETFTTTDSSIAGVAPGPLSCKLADLEVSAPQDDQSENASQTVLDQAVEDALSTADGSESSAADLNSMLPGARWSCTVATDDSVNNYTLEFLNDGSGFLSEFPIAWSSVDDTPGLVALSIMDSNDGAIGGITVENSNYFTAAFGRFGDTYVVPDGLVECSR